MASQGLITSQHLVDKETEISFTFENDVKLAGAGA